MPVPCTCGSLIASSAGKCLGNNGTDSHILLWHNDYYVYS